ncbi:MAG: D-glycero-beta-D-manno-heptose 1,7-bisphosphate 7-phosphatase [Desulfobacterales bacterium]|nr:D-glycero-beta-D-manno-heptose 1,7-bisphosphate 7-phosphatase [Desulfobacterales bacterium]
MKIKKYVFLDRDGVINEDPGYVQNWRQFKFLDGSIEAITKLYKNGFDVIIITNQSGVKKGIINLDDLKNIFKLLKSEIKANGGEIKDIFYCPHSDVDECVCRKPKPGMILKAKDIYNIDISQACLVGDSARDIECGINAGCGHTILVKTGHGHEAKKTLSEKNIYPNFIANDLFHASEWIIKNLL